MALLERIVQALGGDLLEGGRRALIPGPGHSPEDRSVSLLETDDGRVLIYCFSPKDDWRDVKHALEAHGLLPTGSGRIEAGPAWSRAKPRAGASCAPLARARRFWDEALPIKGSPALRYLKRRAIPAALAQAAPLRFHPCMPSLEDRLLRPALLSAITDSENALQGIEVTLLASHGGAKAHLATPRRVIGRLMGGAVRISEAHDELVIAEGVESAASAGLALGAPSWALLSAHNLALFKPAPHLKRLIVAIDNDMAGRAAFERLRRRTMAALSLECAPPPGGVNDWNDWARKRRDA